VSARPFAGQEASEILYRATESIVERNDRFPAEEAARERYVWAALRWIVLRQRTIFYRGRGPGQADDALRQLANGYLMWIADIDRSRDLIGCVHEADEPLYQIRRKTKRPCLTTIAVKRNWRTAKRLHDEVGDNATVVRMHTRSVRIENSHNLDSDTVLSVIIEKQCFCGALAFVIARAWA
jgi:hypothetical protein